MSCETPLDMKPHGSPNKSVNPPHSGVDTGLLVSLLSLMKEGINQTSSLLIDFISKSGKDISKWTAYSEHSGSVSEVESSEPEIILDKLLHAQTAPKRARYSTKQGHFQTTKIVRAPSGKSSDVEVEKSQGPDDDLQS